MRIQTANPSGEKVVLEQPCRDRVALQSHPVLHLLCSQLLCPAGWASHPLWARLVSFARDLLCEGTPLPTLTPSLVLSCGPLHSAHTSLLAVSGGSLIHKTQILNMVSGGL